MRIYYPASRAPGRRRHRLGADLIGISTTTSTAPAAFALADGLRAAGLPVIIGGPHPTFAPDEVLPHADFVARGEGGDGLMLELIEALSGARELESVQGLSFWRDGQPVHNDLRDRCADLDTLPTPDFSLIVGSGRMRETPMLTSLGCPYDCTFCTVTMMFGRSYRFAARRTSSRSCSLADPGRSSSTTTTSPRTHDAPRSSCGDDRLRPHDEVAGPGAHGCGQGRGAADAHGAPGCHRSISGSSPSTRLPWTATTSRRL